MPDKTGKMTEEEYAAWKKRSDAYWAEIDRQARLNNIAGAIGAVTLLIGLGFVFGWITRGWLL
jgi:hypothetical protein